VFLFLGRQNDRHAPTGKVERDLIEFFEAVLELDFFLQLDIIERRRQPAEASPPQGGQGRSGTVHD
jgi:hypothetical protein